MIAMLRAAATLDKQSDQKRKGDKKNNNSKNPFSKKLVL